MLSPTITPSIDPTVYRRQARRIRARFVGRPGAMHAALAGLAERSNRRAWRGEKASITASEAIARGFSDFVADRVRVTPFTFTDRMQVMQSGERIGISRFRANLTIALAQHALSDASAPPQSDHRRRSIRALVLGIVLAECIAGVLLILTVG